MAFTYEIIRQLAVLSGSGGWTKEVNLISYRGDEPKIDIRNWQRIGSEEKLLKGITLTDEEAFNLMQALKDFFKNEGK